MAAWKSVRTLLRLNIKKEENGKKEDEKSRDMHVQNFKAMERNLVVILRAMGRY